VWPLVALLALIELHGPDGHTIHVNPAEITSLRAPQTPGGFAKGTRCLITLTNRSFIAVAETCDQVRQKLEQP
jgi:hypothetical protein